MRLLDLGFFLPIMKSAAKQHSESEGYCNDVVGRNFEKGQNWRLGEEKAKRGGVHALEVNADVARMGVIVEFIFR
jgi:hypothetical protein